MSEHIIKYILMLFLVLMGALDISGAAKGFAEGKYFVAGIDCMLAIWMICLFVKASFEI